MPDQVEQEFSKYEPNKAPTIKHGGNDAIHDGIVTESSPEKNTSRVPGAGQDGL